MWSPMDVRRHFILVLFSEWFFLQWIKGKRNDIYSSMSWVSMIVRLILTVKFSSSKWKFHFYPFFHNETEKYFYFDSIIIYLRNKILIKIQKTLLKLSWSHDVAKMFTKIKVNLIIFIFTCFFYRLDLWHHRFLADRMGVEVSFCKFFWILLIYSTFIFATDVKLFNINSLSDDSQTPFVSLRIIYILFSEVLLGHPLLNTNIRVLPNVIIKVLWYMRV